MSFSLQAIREALANQIQQNIDRSTTVHPYDPGDHQGPSIIINAGDPYMAIVTMGSVWEANILFDLTIECPAARLADAQKAMDAYLSAGTANTSSVIDAIEIDQTLGGVVENCITIGVDAPNLGTDPITTIIHVQAMTSR